MIVDCTRIKDNYATRGGGIYSHDSQIEILDCEISNNIVNISYASGGGVYLNGGTTKIINSIVINNSAPFGAGIYNSSDLSIFNSVITNNIGHGVYARTNLNVYNCIISENTYYGIYNFDLSTSHNILFNNIYNNIPSNSFQINFLGEIVSTNNNSDPCDPWYNISMDPMFVDAANEDFRLLAGSPCIDAGTNSIDGYTFPLADLAGNYRIWDGDGNGSAIVDMGAYEYGAPTGIEEQEQIVQNFELYQNYPNPFNPVTTISYALPQASQVELNVYNLNGQLVKSLVNGKMDKGMHKAEFNGNDLTSGMYIYNLKVDGKVMQSKKMMLLK